MEANVLHLAAWRKSIDGLHVIGERFLPPYTQLEPDYSRGDDLCWRVIFSDGRIGWGESLAVNSHRTRTYYVPPDIADEPWLVAAAEVGYDTMWAASDEAKYNQFCERSLIAPPSTDLGALTLSQCSSECFDYLTQAEYSRPETVHKPHHLRLALLTF